ncbi:phosphatase PAP2 family protein [Plantactinospora veratri]|uniref:Phosphatase PAP2 family protein n=1 Tax=Plantactinospora veratri TaxID=1436122 RepID=A0ABU7SGA9_9ACTN
MHPVSPYPSTTPPGVPARSDRRPAPADRGPARRLRHAALGYLLAFVLTAVGFVGTGAGQLLDGTLLPRAERGGGYAQPTDLVEPARTVLAWFGDPAVLGLLLVAVLLLGVLGRRPWAGVAGVGLVGAAVLGAGVAKRVILRPELGVATSTTHNSFPSGHVAAAMALLLAVLLVLPAPARRWCAAPGAVGVCTVAASTMIAGWHRFSDVLGGVLLAAALFCLVAAALARPRRDSGAVTAAVEVGSFGLLGGVPLLALLVGVPAHTPYTAAGGAGGLFVAIVAGSGFVVLVVATLLVLLRPVDFVGPVAGRRPGPDPEPDTPAAEG